MKPNVSSFADNTVEFEDGNRVPNVDVVIFATGFSFGFPTIENGNLITVNENKVDLYQYMYPPQLVPHVSALFT